MSKKPNNPLDRELVKHYRGSVQNELLTRSLADFLDWLADEYRQHIELVQAQQERINELERFAPTEISTRLMTDEEGESLRKQAENEGIYLLETPQEKVRLVHITLSIREPPKSLDEPITFSIGKVSAMFPGTTEEIQEEIGSRLRPLAYRAPLPENLRKRDIPGVTNEHMLDAMVDVASWWFNEDFRKNHNEDYFDRLKTVYRDKIRPHVRDDFDHIQGYDRWRKSVEESFKHMSEHGRGDGQKPRKRQGKTKLPLTKASLRRNSS